MTGKTIKAIRGMNDILPSQIAYWHYLESRLRQLVNRYGYQEVRFPIVESTHLFSRAVGEVTDIVEKEMYTFEDRNGDSLTLRPEGTAGCVRAGIENGLIYNQQQRLWYLGPMFRHERPQKGRYRQFYQFGIEAFGMAGPDIDAEQIIMTARLWKELLLDDVITLQLNSLGDLESREAYKKALIEYFEKHYDNLDDESKRRLKVNPLRILDSKNPEVNQLFAGAPIMTDYLDEKSLNHFTMLRKYLDQEGIKYEINPRLVRGLDYYGMTIYEWVTDRLGAQGTVCAGGRYNRLVELLGGKTSPAVGFSIGLERVVALLETVYSPKQGADVYIILVGDDAELEGLSLAENLRVILPELSFVMNCGGGNFKTQFKRADKSGAKVALILGEEEVKNKKISVKYLREDREQMQVSFDQLQSLILEAIVE